MATPDALARRSSSVFWKDALRRRMLAGADALAILAAAAATGLVEGGATALWVAATLPLWMVVAKLRGLYDRDHVRIRYLTLEDSPGLFHWSLLCGAATAAAVSALPGDLLSVRGAIVMALTAFVAAFTLRAGARALWRRVVPAERGMIIGSGQLADSFARRLALEPGHHIGIVAQVPVTNGGEGLEDWEGVARTLNVERVIVALHDLDERTLSRITSDCRALRLKLSVAPPIRAMLGTAVELTHLAELPLIEFRTWDPSRSTMLVKRAIDLVGASVALVLLSPFIAFIAAAIKLDSRGPAFFRQRRAGRGGTPFQMIKFRTMVADAEARVGEVVPLERLTEPVFKVRGDPRVTRVGRLLRRSSLDELPQLINVIRGEMSLVGPRPEEVWLVERYEEKDRFRLEVRPGMTGPMQVHGRGELTFAERMSVEREYVENYSLRKDFKILFETFTAVVNGRGAY